MVYIVVLLKLKKKKTDLYVNSFDLSIRIKLTGSVLGIFFLNIFSQSPMKKTDGCNALPTCKVTIRDKETAFMINFINKWKSLKCLKNQHLLFIYLNLNICGYTCLRPLHLKNSIHDDSY